MTERYGAPILEIEGIDPVRFRDEVLPSGEPVVFRGLAAHWPAVRAGSDLPAYLRRFGEAASCDLIEGPPAIRGRFAYDAEVTGFNFRREPTTLGPALRRIAEAAGHTDPPALAIQALRAAEGAPGFAADNPAPLIDDDPAPRLWIGNRVVVAVHHDLSRNVAVVVAGRRRFTLFPPDQVANLYLGPLEFSPAGTPISMVDHVSPDLARYPRFADAMTAARTVELAPGDAIYMPYMWWHGVESLADFNVLANYWWNETPPPQPGLAPIDVLMHARLAFSALTAEQRAAWRPMIDHIVFDDAGAPDHLPPTRRGIRGGIGEAARTKLRRQLAVLMGR